MTADDNVSIMSRKPSEDGKFKILVLVVILSLVVTIIALILASVAVTKKNGAGTQTVPCDCPARVQNVPSSTVFVQSGNSLPEEKIWMFQIGHYQSVAQYLHEASGTIRGYNVDIVNAVCQLANKNCQLVYDVYERCWDSEAGQRARGGVGLMADWYDTCVGWAHSYDRARTLLFSNQFEKLRDNAIVTTRLSSSVNTLPSNLTGYKIGFLDGWISDEHCMARFDEFTSAGFDQNDVEQVLHYTTEREVVEALKSEEINFAFTANFSGVVDDPDVKIVWYQSLQRCTISGISLMMRKDKIELKNWWDAAFDRLRVTSQYESICERVSIVHGNHPGLSPQDVCV